jgi:hypothetical protein
VAGVVAALEAHDALSVLGQPVDDLALAFIAPLGADDHDVLAHVRYAGYETFGASRARATPETRAFALEAVRSCRFSQHDIRELPQVEREAGGRRARPNALPMPS